MYDVNFGGIEHMTKRLTIALVAVALFVLMAVMPVSAAYKRIADRPGATVFIGEEGLNLTHALNGATTGGGVAYRLDQAPGNLTIGWWASAATITTSAPTKTINLAGRYTNFQVAPSDFVGYTGNWYLLKADGTTAQTGLGDQPGSCHSTFRTRPLKLQHGTLSRQRCHRQVCSAGNSPWYPDQDQHVCSNLLPTGTTRSAT